jgi:hypothetical protein
MKSAPIPTDFGLLLLRPQRLISLWDMIQFSYHEFQMPYDIVSCGRDKFGKLAAESGQQGKLSQAQKDKLLSRLSEAKNICDKLECALSLEIIRQIEFDYSRPDRFPFCHEVSTTLIHLLNCMGTEMSELHFAFIPKEKAGLFEQGELFGPDVNNAFPEAQDEIKDAGNCIAADLNTAAVFHLMRAAEHGLRSLAIHLKVKIKGQLDYAEWGTVLARIDDKLTAIERKPRGKKKSEELEFYRLIQSECKALKDVWRNNVMHTRGRYNHKEATGVLQRVQDFLVRLAGRVKEP